MLAGLPAGGPSDRHRQPQPHALPLLGALASVTWKLTVAVAVSPSPSVTVNVAVASGTGLDVTASAVNEYDPSAFTFSSPGPMSIACE